MQHSVEAVLPWNASTSLFFPLLPTPAHPPHAAAPAPPDHRRLQWAQRRLGHARHRHELPGAQHVPPARLGRHLDGGGGRHGRGDAAPGGGSAPRGSQHPHRPGRQQVGEPGWGEGWRRCWQWAGRAPCACRGAAGAARPVCLHLSQPAPAEGLAVLGAPPVFPTPPHRQPPVPPSLRRRRRAASCWRAGPRRAS